MKSYVVKFSSIKGNLNFIVMPYKKCSKQEVLHYYYSTSKGIRGTARVFGINPTLVGKWVNESLNRF